MRASVLVLALTACISGRVRHDSSAPLRASEPQTSPNSGLSQIPSESYACPPSGQSEQTSFVAPEHVHRILGTDELPAESFGITELHGSMSYKQWIEREGQYPQSERSTIFYVCLGVTGAVLSASVASSSGDQNYDDKARRLVMRWKYEPYLTDGHVAPILTLAVVKTPNAPSSGSPTRVPQ